MIKKRRHLDRTKSTNGYVIRVSQVDKMVQKLKAKESLLNENERPGLTKL